jgi:hypothetical protein
VCTLGDGIRARVHLAETAADLDPSNEAVARLANGTPRPRRPPERIRVRVQRLTQALDEIDEEPSPETTALTAALQQEISRREADGSR